MSENCFMASVDLRHYSIPVAKEHRKYLRSIFEGQLYGFTCLPNGLSSCPKKFAKVLKPPLSTLPKLVNISLGYLDDIYLHGKTYEECLENVIETVPLFAKLGFVIRPIKSNLIHSTGADHSPPQRLGTSDRVSGQRAWREIGRGRTIKRLCGGEWELTVLGFILNSVACHVSQTKQKKRLHFSLRLLF